MSRRRSEPLGGWRSTQSRLEDGTIVSVQRAVAPAPVVEASEQGARRLGRSYWLEVERAGRGLVRCRVQAAGVQVRLAGLGPPLLAFGPAEVAVAEGHVGCRYPIVGGLLARRPGGSLGVAQVREGRIELRAAVEGFAPRLRALYDLQRRAHVAISRRYLRRLLAGEGP